MKKRNILEFNLPKIEGISEKSFQIHLGLYAGYVNALNDHYEKIEKVDGIEKSALRRMISFELAGVINHELYFESLVGGSKEIEKESPLFNTIQNQYGSYDKFIETIKLVSLTRGIGWVIIVYDKKNDLIDILWVRDHELGNVNLPALFVIDMWEHAFMIDYMPKDKGEYVSVYLNAMNWKTVNERFIK